VNLCIVVDSYFFEIIVLIVITKRRLRMKKVFFSLLGLTFLSTAWSQNIVLTGTISKTELDKLGLSEE